MSRRPAASLRVLVASVAVAVGAVGACSPGGADETVEPGEGGTSSPSTATSSPGAGSGTAGSDDATAPSTGGTSDGTIDPVTEVAVASTLATGLPAPWGLARLPDGSALVTLRDEARVVVVTPTGEVRDVTGDGAQQLVDETVPDGEGGLLGVAAVPGEAGASGADALDVVIYRTGAEDNAVLRGTLDGTELGPLTVVVDGIPRARTHNGGQVGFGPDGMLYVATGDADQTELAQDADSLAGKILRVTPTGEPAPGNPVKGSRVFSLGHRNVQGIGWSPDGTMYASEFGQNALDELNRIEAGGNYGWPLVEGDEVAGGGPVPDEVVAPVATWATDVASPSGLAVTPSGVWLAGLRGQRLWLVSTEDSEGSGGSGEPEVRDFLTGELGRLRAVVAAGERELWVLTNATDGRGDPGPDDDRLLRVTY
ncbi:PQQ-dependent sugar dehydrogenase [Litorihabitans aurantiacus]|uniref:Oxidoreductase n=1 Tax=Litorihabitans aurantiacus TaxID=1930061 RepID=A0AA37XAT5_9MICO|nr:PQQ-dependent sugar dehydrogenase [Litorihabitans aurantiacus]GMA30464.1 oxidoreductase [Litorihabitans aurantiacus]